MTATKRTAVIEIDESLAAALDDAVARFGSLDALASAALARFLADRNGPDGILYDEETVAFLRERAAEAYAVETLPAQDIFSGLKAKI